ncbi:hypothetical protein BASA50_001379 [Batrachochytrium salamandrivorans]|uniref:DNA mismatch repair protein MutL n=1 Tax=Batrachochytrium salamandrivorans TaxID=1357716 RepID=A0ABQ8EVD3_9FUNG|nr:hypothetical protein BASA60_009188 [Batrachochytrium salamandrivorans]KAH6587246.1 hypothetical protein BASA50_001379 [Batrachochytrium salamandrivorans]KAH9273540.1 hypothetical protein BASA83_004208 [Batrachochytrium salamandrivorans]
MIRSLDRQLVRQICSQQVVIDLAGIVKELVENSLDAGATSIDVKLIESGAEGVEVSDNGSGIGEADLVVLAKRHHTSKIAEFDDILSVSTFGFRGEALNSLCTIAKVVLTTSTRESAPVGYKMEYDSSGNVTQQTRVARAQGTTVSITNIFHHLPVRLHEFRRKIKKEYTKCVDCVQAYALSSTGVRLSFSNTTSKGLKSTIIQTQGSNILRENVTSVFGAVFSKCVLDIRFEFIHKHGDCGSITLSTDEATLPVASSDKDTSFVVVSGMISKPQAGCGRSSRDRQFIFVNRRPVDLPKVARAVTDAFHEIVPSQYPLFILNITLTSGLLDINLTPDKRMLGIANESNIVYGIHEGVKRSLQSLCGIFDQPISSSQGESSQKSASNTFQPTLRSSQQPPNPRFSSNRTKAVQDVLQNSLVTMDPILSLIHEDHEVVAPVDLSRMRSRFESRAIRSRTSSRSRQVSLDNKLSVPTFVCKSDFASMDIIGQFNLGFILVLHGNMLFIVDQHASDEKYRYETLQRVAITTSQPLVQKIPLSLTPQQECLVLERMYALGQRGFHIEHSEDAIHDRFQLTSVPHIRDLHLGVSDLEEILIKMESTSIQHVPHCSRVLRYFASKACRKSVMIGDTLSSKMMRNIVQNMGNIDQPWNCPHGRPTMRLLAALLE